NQLPYLHEKQVIAQPLGLRNNDREKRLQRPPERLVDTLLKFLVFEYLNHLLAHPKIIHLVLSLILLIDKVCVSHHQIVYEYMSTVQLVKIKIVLTFVRL